MTSPHCSDIRPEQGLWGAPLRVFDELPSTNQWVLQNAATLEHGAVIRALRQSAGRGRFGRAWIAPQARGLTVSCCFKASRLDDTLVTSLGQLAALALRQTLAGFSLPARLKWPNDVLVNGCKIAGILLEQAEETVVLGIGLNVNLDGADFEDAGLLYPATSMAIEAGRPFDIVTVLARLIPSLERIVDRARTDGPGFLPAQWEDYDELSGRAIEVHTADATIAGRYAGLDERGRLRLLDEHGTEQRFWSGDVTLSGSPPESPD